MSLLYKFGWILQLLYKHCIVISVWYPTEWQGISFGYNMVYYIEVCFPHLTSAQHQLEGRVKCAWRFYSWMKRLKMEEGARMEDHRTGEFFWQSQATTEWELMIALQSLGWGEEMGLHIKSKWGSKAQDDSTRSVSSCHFFIVFLSW